MRAPLLLTTLAALGLCASAHKDSGFLKNDEATHHGKHKNADKQLYIHLIAHSHDDVGWLKTVDGYFSGTKVDIQDANVEMTLDTTFTELLKDPRRRYTQVEMKFFSMWWKNQDEQMKAQVRALTQEGRLEFVNAGWSMHDEACTHYEDQINNMMLGHKWLLDNVGVAPRIGWHIDPFGHSNANARLFAEMGFDAIVFARADFQDAAKRMNESSMEWLWRPQFNHVGKKGQLLAHLMVDNTYYPPRYFGFDDNGENEGPFVNDSSLSTFNADWKSAWFVNYVTELATHFRTNHLMIPMGGDFRFINAHLNFVSMDRMIDYINEHYPNVTLLYSTPGMYVDALYNANISWPTKYDDLFPYADHPDDYWTGYFTSRPGAKWQVREGQAYLHASNWLYALKALDLGSTDDEIKEILAAKNALLDSMGIYQHHDAVTGTAKQYVADDYTLRHVKAIRANIDQVGKMINRLSYRSTGLSAEYWSQCHVNNGTYLDCPIVNNVNKSFVVTIHNPSLQTQYYQRIKVPHTEYSAQAWSASASKFVDVNSTVVCHKNTFENGYSIQDCDLFVENKVDGKSLGWLLINYDPFAPVSPPGMNRFQYLTEGSKGSLFSVTSPEDGSSHYMTFQIRYYQADEGGDDYDDTDNVPSGAYIFKPKKDMQFSVPYVNVTKTESFNSSFMQQITLYYSDPETNRSARTIVRAFAKNPAIEFEVLLDPLPASGGGQEVTANFNAYELESNDTFYTDSNGLEMQERVLNYRPTWTLETDEPISANYYPVNSAIVVKDTGKNLSFVVTNDRSQGGSVLDNAHIEFMQSRRLFYDDSRGVGEPLSENGTLGLGIQVQATYTVHFVNHSATYSKQRFQQLVIDDPLQYHFAFNYTLPKSAKVQEMSEYQGDILEGVVQQVSSGQPAPVKFQLFPIQRNVLFVRLENVGDLFDYPNGTHLANTTIYIDIPSLAKNLYYQANRKSAQLSGINIVESQMSGNQNLTNMEKNKFQWKGLDDNQVVEPTQPKDLPNFVVALPAQSIRHFYVEYVPLTAAETKKKEEEAIM